MFTFHLHSARGPKHYWVIISFKKTNWIWQETWKKLSIECSFFVFPKQKSQPFVYLSRSSTMSIVQKHVPHEQEECSMFPFELLQLLCKLNNIEIRRKGRDKDEEQGKEIDRFAFIHVNYMCLECLSHAHILKLAVLSCTKWGHSAQIRSYAPTHRSSYF